MRWPKNLLFTQRNSAVHIETKVAIFSGALIFAFGVAEAIFIHWVGNVNWWVAWFIAAATCSCIEVSTKVRENRKLFDISDKELVRVSALANSLEEKVADLENEIEILKANRD
jgi:hypothetical protein